MGYCVICLIMLFTIATEGFSISSVSHDDGAVGLESGGGAVWNYTDVNEHHERQRRMTHMFKKPPPRDLTSLEQFCKFMKDWLATFKFGFSFTSRPFKSVF